MPRSSCFRTVAFAAIVFLSGAALPVDGADHRDAPAITFSSAVDINDVYMFRNPADKSKLVMILTTHPLGLPDFATSYPYQNDALYRFNFSTNSKAKPTAQIDFVFSAPSSSGQTFTAFFPHNIKLQGKVTRANGTKSVLPPDTVVINDYPKHGIKIFAGPREDPFYFDLVGFNRVVGGVGGFRGIDSFSSPLASNGLNTNAIIVEFPIALVAGKATKFSAWGVTYLAKKGDRGDDDHRSLRGGLGRLDQADRMGNPAVNTALIPSALKDAFNAGEPENDAKDFAKTILNSLKAFGTNATNTAILASVAVPDTLKFDVTADDKFPNGRHPRDDVIETLLSLILGAPGQTAGIDDGVPANDKPFLDVFPYLAAPNQPSNAP
jgi:hypothetical protein